MAIIEGKETSGLREEHRLTVFKKRVLRISGPEREKVKRVLTKFYIEELHKKSTISWEVMPCSLIEIYLLFRVGE
jgi:hypothetical protein